MLSGKSILVTGGTGSFGKKFTSVVLDRFPFVKRIVVYSRDELKQFNMNEEFANTSVEFIIGDIRDKTRLIHAMQEIDIVIHAAALKQVPIIESNPFEAIKTNVIGAQNVIEAASICGVKQVIALSSDKAASPINLYGATKLCSDKLFVAANNPIVHKNMMFSVIRYGNVMGSRGSVVPFFISKKDSGVIPITDKKMTRFNMLLEDSVELVLTALKRMWGGEIFIPKIPSYNIMDVAKAIAPECEYKVIGIRPGEKLHEEMITKTDAINSIEFDTYYVTLPSTTPLWSIEEFRTTFNGEFCPNGFCYSSDTNTDYLTIDQIRSLIQKGRYLC